MTKKVYINPEILQEFLSYDQDSGLLFWKPRDRKHFSHDRIWKAWNTKNANREAFTSRTDTGYKHGSILGKSVTAHRVAWVLYHGDWPKEHIDHINGIRTDNRIHNLREASNAQNGQNYGLTSKNKSGYKGVRWVPEKKKWIARVYAFNKMHHIGYYNSCEDAVAAYRAKAKDLHGDFYCE